MQKYINWEEGFYKEMNNARTEKLIELAKTDEYKVCIWGAGYVGTNYGFELLKEFGINVDFYCDNNESLYGKEIKDGIVCINKKYIPTNVIFFILTSGHLFMDITKQLSEMGITNVVNYLELCEYRSKNFFEFQRRNQIAVYSCIVGDYDEVAEPEIVEENCDYYLISDRKPKENSVYKYLDIRDVIEGNISDATRMNRFCKINAHKLFPQYRYSIYFDGNFVLKGRMSKYISSLPQSRIIGLARTGYRSIYAEALRCMQHGRDDKKTIEQQVEKYWLEGMPDDFGLILPGIMIREHNNYICKKIMEEWWAEVNFHSKRDMIALSYVLWNKGYTIKDIGTLSDLADIVDGDEWLYRREHGKRRTRE